jgi:hypothetical protein
MFAAVNCTDAERVEIELLADCLTSKVTLDEPEIIITHPHITTDNDCTNDQLHCGMQADCEHCYDEGDKIDDGDSIPNASQGPGVATEFNSFAQGTSAADGYKVNDADDAYADEEKPASQSDDGST